MAGRAAAESGDNVGCSEWADRRRQNCEGEMGPFFIV